MSSDERTTSRVDRRKFLKTAGVGTVVALAGCSGGGGDGGGDGGDGGDGGTTGDTTPELVDSITVLAESVADNLVLQQMVQEDGMFTEETGIDVTFETFGYNQVQESAATQVASDQSDYDVMTIDTYWLGDFALGENLVPIGDWVADSGMVSKDVYIEEVWDTVAHFEGTNYTLPFWQWTLGAGYREDIIQDSEIADAYQEETGNELGPAETVDEYVEQSKWITDYTGGDMHGAVMMGQRGTKANDQWLGLFQGKGGTFIDEQGNPVYGDYRQEAIEATEAWIELIQEAGPDGSASWGFPEVSEHVGKGAGFSAINYNIFYVNMNNSLSENTENGKIKQYDTPGGSPAVGSWSLGIPSNLPEERQRTAWKFIEWVNAFENRKERILRGGSPVCTDTLNDQEVIDSNPLLWENLQDLISGGKSISKYPGALEANRSNGVELSAALAGDKSVEDAIDAGISAVEDAMSG